MDQKTHFYYLVQVPLSHLVLLQCQSSTQPSGAWSSLGLSLLLSVMEFYLLTGLSPASTQCIPAIVLSGGNRNRTWLCSLKVNLKMGFPSRVSTMTHFTIKKGITSTLQNVVRIQCLWNNMPFPLHRPPAAHLTTHPWGHFHAAHQLCFIPQPLTRSLHFRTDNF